MLTSRPPMNLTLTDLSMYLFMSSTVTFFFLSYDMA